MSQLANSPMVVAVIALVLICAILFRSKIEIRIGGFHAELRPNGGRSMKDRADRTDRNLFIIAAHLGIAEKLEAPPEFPIVVAPAASETTG